MKKSSSKEINSNKFFDFELAEKTCKTTFVVLSQVIGIRLYELMFTNQTYYYYNQWADIPVLVNTVKKIL